MYAVNLSDLTECGLPAQMLVKSFTNQPCVVTADAKQVDGDAILCDNPDDKQTKAALQILVKIAKNRQALMRIYEQGKRGGWKRVVIDPTEITPEMMSLVDPKGQLRFLL